MAAFTHSKFASAAPVAEKCEPLDNGKWIDLLKTVDGLGQETFRGHLKPPSARPILPCDTPGAAARTVQPRLCFEVDKVAGPEARLHGQVTDCIRLQILRHYLARYHLAKDPQAVPLAYFNPKSLVKKKVPAANVINELVGKVRFALYEDLFAVLNEKPVFEAAEAGAPFKQSFKAANDSRIFGLERQIRLLDDLFLDGPVWEMLLYKTRHLKARPASM